MGFEKSTATDKRHVGRHHRGEQDIGRQGQASHGQEGLDHG
jgi:hypothetical protein